MNICIFSEPCENFFPQDGPVPSAVTRRVPEDNYSFNIERRECDRFVHPEQNIEVLGGLFYEVFC